MNRIHLTRSEKKIFRELAAKPIRKATVKPIEYIATLYTLRKAGLLKFRYIGESTVTEANLTQKGYIYLEANPKLRGPFPWEVVTKLSLLIAVFSLLLDRIIH